MASGLITGTLPIEDLTMEGSDDEWDDAADDEWDTAADDEDVMVVGPVKCLFCEEEQPSAVEVFTHCKDKHQFDIVSVSHTWNLDCIGYIKMINYIRLKKPVPDFVCKRLSLASASPWDDDLFMQPTDPDDFMLQYDIEEMNSSSTNVKDCSSEQNTNQSNSIIKEADVDNEGEVTLTKGDYLNLLHRAHTAEENVRQSEDRLKQVLDDLQKVRTVMKELVMSQTEESPSMRSDAEIVEDVDEAYFNSYSHFSIHEEMIKDKVRTESYRDCMFKNKSLFEGKVVLDVGCGTGILSIFAAQAGASHVIGVDQSDIIYQAMDIVRENGMEKKVTLIRGRIEDVDLPVEKVDIIISEWMGYFLLFESMLDTVLFARDRYLKEGGVVLPNRCTMSLVGVCNNDSYDSHIKFWDDVYGIKMSCMKFDVIHEANVGIVNSAKLTTDSCVFKEILVSECRVEDLQFSAPFSLNCMEDGPVTAISGYFDIFFESGCDTPISFSTGPRSTPTHWKQTFFLLEPPLQLKKGEKIEGTIKCQKNRKDPRALVILLTYNGKKQYYAME